MAAIDQKLIDRINVLAKKKKEGTITPEELKEQDKLGRSKINEKIIMEESGDYRNGRNNDDDDGM
mgnify:FL=1